MNLAPLLAALVAAAPTASKKIAVFDLEATGAPAALAAAASLVVPTEVRARNPGAHVISSADLHAMLGLEREKRMLGCEESASCMAEVGGAMGVDELVAGRLGMVGRTWVLELHRTDVPRAQVVSSAVRTVRGEEDALVGALRDAVGELYPGAAPAPKDRGASREADRVLSGAVTEGGKPVADAWVRIHDPVTGAQLESVRTRPDGSYRLQLRRGVYSVRSRGQEARVDLTGGDSARRFPGSVGRITATLLDAAGRPVVRAKAVLFDPRGSLPPVSYEVSDADGRVTLFTPEPGRKHLLEILLDRGQASGSMVYGRATQLLRGATVTAPAAGQVVDLGPLRLPAGAVLAGFVTHGGRPAAHAAVVVRVGGRAGRNRFVQTRARHDGSYSLSLPAGLSVARLCALAPRARCPAGGRGAGSGPGYAFVDGVVLGGAGSTTTRDLAF
jgi:hypothetical protein